MITPHDVDGLVWTAAQLQQVSPSRALPDPDLAAHLDTIGVQAVGPGARYAKCRSYWLHDDRHRRLLTFGIERTPDALRELADRVLARCLGAPDEPPTTPLDLDLEAATVGLERCPVFAAVPWWVEQQGLVFAVQALVRSFDFTNQAGISGYSDTIGDWLVQTRDRAWQRPEYADTAWRFLRACLAVADDATCTAARDVAEGLRRTAALPAQAGLAFAFHEQAWADDVVDAVMPIVAPRAKQKHHTPFLARLVGVAGTDAAIRLLGCNNDALKEGDLLTALAHHRHAAVSVIAAAWAHAANNDQRLQAARALLPVRTAEATTLLTTWATEKKVVAPVLKKHLALLAR